jgi:hypothetical protein
MICTTQECHSYANLAVDVLKNQKQPLAKSLKSFFKKLPETDITPEILTTALDKLADSDPETCRWIIWILQNSYELKPYYEFIEQSIDLTVSKLETKGIVFS